MQPNSATTATNSKLSYAAAPDLAAGKTSAPVHHSDCEVLVA